MTDATSRQLPQTGAETYFTDGGLETSMVFRHGLDLPHFAAFVLLCQERGVRALTEYYRSCLAVAEGANAGFILETPTWRANPDWGARLDYSRETLDQVNRGAVRFVKSLRAEAARPERVLISGALGPRGDGYLADCRMSVDEAAEYHRPQLQAFADAGADMAGAMTLTYPEEAAGIVQAAGEVGIPVAISFTTETDGRLPDGHTLGAAIERVDDATGAGAAYSMITRAPPEHFADTLDPDAGWARRVRGVRANASRRSHAELDEMAELDDGDPDEFGRLYVGLRERLPWLTVLGGCCGTDHRHLDAVRHLCRA